MRYALLAVLFAAACGGTTDTDDLGTDDFASTTPDLATVPTVYKLVSGNYIISNATTGTDGCDVQADGFNGVAKALTNDGMGNVALAAFGSGTVGSTEPNQGQLVYSMNDLSLGASCLVDDTVTSEVTVTADNTFTLASTEVQSNRRACTAPSDAMCTSTYTLTFTKQ